MSTGMLRVGSTGRTLLHIMYCDCDYSVGAILTDKHLLERYCCLQIIKL